MKIFNKKAIKASIILLIIGIYSCAQKNPDYTFPEKSEPGEIITIDLGCYYLPKSYSNDKKYAMVVLLHPIGIDHNGFLDQNEFLEQAEISMKYEGYIRKEREMVDKMNKLEKVRISDGFEYDKLHSLSSEAREKLMEIKPETIGQASRISGVSPADISVLLVYLGR